MKEEFAFRARVTREHAAYEALLAVQQPNKLRSPSSLAALVRLIERLTTEKLWPRETKWQHAADRLLDRNGKPITGKQLSSISCGPNFKAEIPTNDELRQFLLNLSR